MENQRLSPRHIEPVLEREVSPEQKIKPGDEAYVSDDGLSIQVGRDNQLTYACTIAPNNRTIYWLSETHLKKPIRGQVLEAGLPPQVARNVLDVIGELFGCMVEDVTVYPVSTKSCYDLPYHYVFSESSLSTEPLLIQAGYEAVISRDGTTMKIKSPGRRREVFSVDLSEYINHELLWHPIPPTHHFYHKTKKMRTGLPPEVTYSILRLMAELLDLKLTDMTQKERTAAFFAHQQFDETALQRYRFDPIEPKQR
jgi:hypothetical protein